MSAAPKPPTSATFQTISSRLLVWVLAVVVPIYAGALYLSFRAAAERLEADAIDQADDLAARLASGLDALVRPIEGGAQTLAFQLEEIDPPRGEYLPRIRALLDAWPEVYGSTIAVETSSSGPNATPFAPYLYRRDGEIRYSDLAAESYAYRELPWYRVAADGGAAVWSEPYFDAGGGDTWMVTYSVPYFRRGAQVSRRLAGVVTADLDLDWVSRTAAEVPLGAVGVGWLSPADPDNDFIAPIGATPDRLGQWPGGIDAAEVRAAGASMRASGASFRPWNGSAGGGDDYLAVRDLSTLGWQLTLLLPRRQLLAEAQALLRRQIGLGLVGLFVLIGAVSLVASGVARPIRRLADTVGGAADGNLDFVLPKVPQRDEVGVLTAALSRLQDSLQEHIELRAASLAENARLERELEVSARLQQSMLPHEDSLQDLPSEVEIAVVLHPARQVGGDIYDCFQLADGRVLFLVGDVSDKGIPAALFMARMSALLRVLGAGGHTPDWLLHEINERLVEGNETCMFVTAACGVLDPKTGRLCLASAGHEPPLLRRVEGAVEALDAENGPAIGLDEGVEYPLRTCILAPGDAIVLFTDGVTEAERADGAQFGTERLAALLADGVDTTPQALIARIVEQISSYTSGYQASDDLTAMVLRFVPSDVMPRSEPDGAGWRIEVATSRSGLAHVQQRLRDLLESRGTEPEQLQTAELVVEEWLTNVIRALAVDGSNASHKASVDIVVTRSNITLTFRDDGEAFDPLAVELPVLDADADVAELTVGGFGLHLIRELADACRYQRADGTNVLQIKIERTRAC